MLARVRARGRTRRAARGSCARPPPSAPQAPAACRPPQLHPRALQRHVTGCHSCHRRLKWLQINILALTIFVATAYDIGMSALRPSWTADRLAVAVVALYAFALQVFLGGVFSASLSGPDHYLCAEALGADDGGPAKHLPAHTGYDCCTAADTQLTRHVPILAASSVVWPHVDAVSLACRPQVLAIPRAPPRSRAHARAPPVV